MTSITSLPCELINATLQHVGSLQNLSSALLSCRHVHASFQENPHLAVDILRRQIGPELLPYAVAVLSARKAKTAPEIRALLERLKTSMKNYQMPPAELATIPFAGLAQMSQTHEIVHGLVSEYAARAWAQLLQTACQSEENGEEGDNAERNNKDPFSLSPREYVRFCRAFYRLELYMRLFSQPEEVEKEKEEKPEAKAETETEKEAEAEAQVEDRDNDGEEDEQEQVSHVESSLLRSFPAWENEGIACALDFLELEISKATRDVVAHDIFFGEMRIDYLTHGLTNDMRQRWLAQGIGFLHKLRTESSFEAKRDLLASTFASNSTDLNLQESLIYLYIADGAAAFPPPNLEDYSDDQRAALFQPSEPNIDADRGPFEGWWAANCEMPLARSLMMAYNAGFRERAYVLWDEDRLAQPGLFAVFKDKAPPSELELEDTESQQDEMEESFAARSKIYQKGGRGYWNKGDESNIV